MKVAVITRHAITNYGSLLQALATQIVLERLGYESEIIDYIRDDESYQKHEITLLKRKPSWYNNPLKRIIYLSLRQPESIFAGRRFEKERRKLLKMSKRYSTFEALVQNPPDADIYLTGSDQVWGPVENGTYDPVYCLSFVPKGSKKISYAASFGHTDMNDELQEYFKHNLSGYDAITVRENSALKLLSDLGLKAKQVIDPTLLLTSDEWNKYIIPPKRGKYILVYQLHNNPRLDLYAEKVSKDKQLPIVRVSALFHQIIRKGKLVVCPKMGEFLGYIRYAECMITDSFHGTAFALNFNIPFVEVLPNNNTGTRNISILMLTGLSNRILQDENDISLASEEIDFAPVNAILKRERLKSIDVLKGMIEQLEG